MATPGEKLNRFAVVTFVAHRRQSHKTVRADLFRLFDISQSAARCPLSNIEDNGDFAVHKIEREAEKFQFFIFVERTRFAERTAEDEGMNAAVHLRLKIFADSIEIELIVGSEFGCCGGINALPVDFHFF